MQPAVAYCRSSQRPNQELAASRKTLQISHGLRNANATRMTGMQSMIRSVVEYEIALKHVALQSTCIKSKITACIEDRFFWAVRHLLCGVFLCLEVPIAVAHHCKYCYEADCIHSLLTESDRTLIQELPLLDELMQPFAPVISAIQRSTTTLAHCTRLFTYLARTIMSMAQNCLEVIVANQPSAWLQWLSSSIRHVLYNMQTPGST
jgi:hypothetical protein